MKPDLTWPAVGDVLQTYGGQPRGGSGWRSMRCPFHNDHSASAAVNHAANVFFCHACGISTTGLGLIMQREGMTLAQARSFAGDRFGGSDTAVRAEPKFSHPLFSGAGDHGRNSLALSAGSGEHSLFRSP